MNFEEYQKKSRETALYPNVGDNYIYPVLGLGGETGEISEKAKKIIRDKGGKINKDTREELAKELGDVLWYLSQLASELKLSLNDIAEGNIKKLQSRIKRGKIGGDGDNR